MARTASPRCSRAWLRVSKRRHSWRRCSRAGRSVCLRRCQIAKGDKIDPDVKSDPRVRDVVKFNRIRDAVEKEVFHQAWGCQLWALERLEKITKEQRMAGDAYIHLTEAYRAILYGPQTEFSADEATRAKRVKERYGKVQGLLTHGDIKIRRAVDELCFEELYPACEADLRRVKDGLSRLELFFNLGTKR